MARDQRTRLNAELAHQYAGTRKRQLDEAAPGRNALTETGVEQEEPAVEGDMEQQVEGEEQEAVEREPRKSIFELPRKETARAPLLGSEPATSEAAPPAAPSTKPTGSRRG